MSAAESVASYRPRARVSLIATLIVAAACLAFGASQAGAFVYVGNSSKWIMRADNNGKHVVKHYINTATRKTDTSINQLAATRKYVYWVTGDGAIGRAKTGKRATRIQRNLVPNNGFANDVAISGQYMYWVNSSSGVGRANLDGSSPNPNFIPGSQPDNNVIGAITVSGGFIYWSICNGNNWGNSGPSGQGLCSIGRANQDGTNVNPNFVTGTYGVSGLDADSKALYAAVTLMGGGGSQVGSIGLGGGATTGFMPTTLANPIQVEGIALSRGTIYLVDQGYQPAAGSIPPRHVFGSVGTVRTNGKDKRDLIRRLSSATEAVAVY